MRLATILYASILVFTVISVLWFSVQFKRERRTLWIGVPFLLSLGSVFGLIMVTLINFENSLIGYFFLMSFIVLFALFALTVGLVLPVAMVIILILSGIRLIRREGLTFSHVLSFAAGILYFLYLVIWPNANDWFANDIYAFFYSIASFLLAYTLLVFYLFTLSSWINLWKIYRKTYDFIIVLGSGLIGGDRVSPLLAGRIEKALALHQEHPESKIIFSGGQGKDEKLPEAAAMAEYAKEKGLPEENSMIEDQSKNTNQNIQFSKRLIEKLGKEASSNVLVVTNRYHLFRALLTAKEEGLKCDGRGSKTKLYFSLNAFLREYIAFIFYWKRTYLIGLMVGFSLIIFRYGVYWITLL